MNINYKGTFITVNKTEDGLLDVYVPSDPQKTDLQDLISQNVDSEISKNLELNVDVQPPYSVVKNAPLSPGDEELEITIYDVPLTIVGYDYDSGYKGDFYEPPRSSGFNNYGLFVTTDPERTDIYNLVDLGVQEKAQEQLLSYIDENPQTRWNESY